MTFDKVPPYTKMTLLLWPFAICHSKYIFIISAIQLQRKLFWPARYINTQTCVLPNPDKVVNRITMLDRSLEENVRGHHWALVRSQRRPSISAIIQTINCQQTAWQRTGLLFINITQMIDTFFFSISATID